MFDQFKTMGAMAGLLKNREKLQAAAARVKRTLDESPSVGEAGGGAVRVTVGGELKVTRVELMPAVVAGMAADESARRGVEALIAEATNDALRRAQERIRDAIDREAKGLGIEGLSAQLGSFLP
ncbi:MAG TPA: YbaB/EbfC family nucleoid-associated protein [Phycisphaerales bacterium]|nr:YbaB/EbfC family nucleoid-associated protein [Phycisphaerales bacterium]